LIYKNHVANGRNWIAFELLEDESIGARFTLFRASGKQTQEIQGGSGYCAQNQRRAHFGLGNADKVQKVEIRLPNGKTETIESPEVNKLHKVSG
jgi:hypothetical protein